MYPKVHVLQKSKLASLQIINEHSASTPATRGEAKSLVWKFFREGKTKEEKICQLCPNHKVIRIKHGGTSNLLRHVKRFHMERLMKEKLKHRVRGKRDMNMIMEERESGNGLDVEDDEDEIIDLISEPLV